jgi:hypothetical protein
LGRGSGGLTPAEVPVEACKSRRMLPIESDVCQGLSAVIIVALPEGLKMSGYSYKSTA